MKQEIMFKDIFKVIKINNVRTKNYINDMYLEEERWYK